MHFRAHDLNHLVQIRKYQTLRWPLARPGVHFPGTLFMSDSDDETNDPENTPVWCK